MPMKGAYELNRKFKVDSCNVIDDYFCVTGQHLATSIVPFI